jgi:hypothetical protein
MCSDIVAPSLQQFSFYSSTLFEAKERKYGIINKRKKNRDTLILYYVNGALKIT